MKRIRTCAILAIAVAIAACSDATATNETPPSGQREVTTNDLLGTYLLTQFDGMPLPAVRAASVANGFKQDTVFAGCLVLGPASARPPENRSDFVNVTWIFAESRDTAFVSTHGKCPLFLPADWQYFSWSGSKGTWAFCGTHSCDVTDFRAAWAAGKLVVSTGTTGHETVYVGE